MYEIIIISISMKILANILWVRVHGVVHRSLSKMVCNNGADSTKHYIARNSVSSVMVGWVKISKNLWPNSNLFGSSPLVSIKLKSEGCSTPGYHQHIIE